MLAGMVRCPACGPPSLARPDARPGRARRAVPGRTPACLSCGLRPGANPKGHGIRAPDVSLSVGGSIPPSLYFSICLAVLLSIHKYMSTCLSVHLSLCMSIRLRSSIDLPLYPNANTSQVCLSDIVPSRSHTSPGHCLHVPVRDQVRPGVAPPLTRP